MNANWYEDARTAEQALRISVENFLTQQVPDGILSNQPKWLEKLSQLVKLDCSERENSIQFFAHWPSGGEAFVLHSSSGCEGLSMYLESFGRLFYYQKQQEWKSVLVTKRTSSGELPIAELFEITHAPKKTLLVIHDQFSGGAGHTVTELSILHWEDNEFKAVFDASLSDWCGVDRDKWRLEDGVITIPAADKTWRCSARDKYVYDLRDTLPGQLIKLDCLEDCDVIVSNQNSPNNHWRAEVGPYDERYDKRLHLFDLRSSTHIGVPLFHADWHITETNWSPDSRQLLAVRALGEDAERLEIWQATFAKEEESPPVLRRILVTDGEVFRTNDFPVLKTTNKEGSIAQQIMFGQWSPNNRHVTFWSGIRSVSILVDGLPLYVLDTDTGQVKKVSEASLCRSFYHSWAPDSSALVLTEGDGRETWKNKWLSLYDLSKDKKRLLIAENLQRPGWVAWSPDGTLIAYAAIPTEIVKKQSEDFEEEVDENPVITQRRIYFIAPKGGQPRRLNKIESFQDAPMWSAEGSQLYYVQRKGDEMALLSFNLTMNTVTQVALKTRQEWSLYYRVGNWQELFAKVLQHH